ncbi:MAG TPA: pyridoxamine 5'-phosphate oxidase family protein [Symbiobacteriaceae bacterium]|nr:pyridoxamine 5'-phosphate oxidase family protein [Symbiobacteriaceae bacterium]
MNQTVEAPTLLSAELTGFLQGPQLVLVTTLDADSQWPTNNLITWVYAKDEGTLRLCADSKGRVMNNIRADDRVLLTVMTGGACHTIEGNARVIKDEIEGVSLKLACAEVAVRTVRDVTFWGGKLTAEPQYDVTYDKALKEKLDSGVFAAMKSL